MVAHHIVFAWLDDSARCTDSIHELIGDVGFVDQSPVKKHRALSHFNGVPWDADDAFDIRLGGIAGVQKNDHIAVADVFDAKAVGKLVDEDPLLITQGRHHRCAFDLYGLIEEEDNRNGDEYAQHEVAQEESR